MTETYPAIYERMFVVLVGNEGGYDTNAKDPGNWTTGKVGQGQCLGTKFGIATASYANDLRRLPPDNRARMPDLVKDFTLDLAKEFYWHAYWLEVGAQHLPGPLAAIVFDAGVNAGVGSARKWLMIALDLPQVTAINEALGAHIKEIISRTGAAQICVEFMTAQLLYKSDLGIWMTFRKGWVRRMFGMCFRAMEFVGT